jgi:hypothetical protein
MISSKEIKAGRVSFGTAITELKPYTNANIVVFVHVEGLDYTRAARILLASCRGQSSGLAVAFTGPAQQPCAVRIERPRTSVTWR